MDNLAMTILVAVLLTVVVYFFIDSSNTGNNDVTDENFGALQSLYSNDGIQDRYLTLENDPEYYDPYKYWRGIPWNLPTRNLNRLTFYPYLYENYVDRYGVMYPYW
jgi:hypothetical protein